ncbi:MAG TPA: DUF2442 domain-containing protein [Negativicutes bacterium]|nr:DUF2442 domain-containing protein [Negativicutes bacterium]
MARITEVIPGDGWLLTVRLDNGGAVTVDLKKKLRTLRFSMLRDREVFTAANTDGNTVYWPEGLTVDLDELLELAKQ